MGNRLYHTEKVSQMHGRDLPQLSRQHELFLRREFRIVLLERLGVAHGDKVRFGVAVAAGDSIEESLLQFLTKEIRCVAVGVVGVADSPGTRDYKSALAVERDVPANQEAARAHFGGNSHGMVEQNFAVSFALVIGTDADGPEGHHADFASVIGVDVRPRVHHVPDDFAVHFQHEREFRHKVGLAPVAVQHVMLGASGTVNVPEGFAGKVFDGLKVARLFRADSVIFH